MSSRNSHGSKRIDKFMLGPEEVRIGDTVYLLPPCPSTPPFIGRVDKIESSSEGDYKVMVLWYYRPEEVRGGRKLFHGEKELFVSDHVDWVSSQSFQGKMRVHSLLDYQHLEHIDDVDYFCRFSYQCQKGTFKPNRVHVYCKCEMPYNPDQVMVECESCQEWFHLTCLDLAPSDVEEFFECEDCIAKTKEEQKLLQARPPKQPRNS